MNGAKVSYDLDGVLAEAPPEPSKPWKNMSGEERRAWQAKLRRHYSRAKLLYCPPEQEFLVVTARAQSYMPETLLWLEKNLPNKGMALHMWPASKRKTLDSVSEWKTRVILENGIIRHTEDNPNVVYRMRKHLVPKGVRVAKFPEEVHDAT